MALKGNLRDFSITQLLNLINLAKKTGLLVIEGPGETARITFRAGKLAFAQVGTEDGSLANILHQTRKISLSQYNLLRQRTAQMTDKELGLLLINAGYRQPGRYPLQPAALFSRYRPPAVYLGGGVFPF